MNTQLTFNKSIKHKIDSFLQPGELIISRKAIIVKTILGSCLSLIMYLPETGLSAICHAVYPTSKSNIGAHKKFHFADLAINFMLDHLSQKHQTLSHFQIKLFGGASRPNQLKSVGSQNIEMAHKILERNNLCISCSDTGGNYGRDLYFDGRTGNVYMKKIPWK